MRINLLLFIILISLFTSFKSNNLIKKEVKTTNQKQSTDSLTINSRYFDNVLILINKPNFYNLVNTRKFQPLYIFTDDKNLSEKFLKESINSPFTSESFIHVIVNLKYKELDSKQFQKFLTKELFPEIEKKYRCHNFRYSVSKNYGNKALSSILVDDFNLFDFYLFILPSEITMNSIEKISEINNKTYKSINFIQWEDKKTNLDINSDLLSINYAYADKNTSNENKRKKISSKLINKYNRYLSEIENEFFENDFNQGDSIINILENYANRKEKLLTPRNTNQLAYNVQSFGHNELSISIINWAISKFPEDINLNHSKGELFHKIGNKKEALKAYKDFKKIVISNKKNLEKSSYEYYLNLYEKSVSKLN